jgi:predicted nucleic acid-binding protein
MRIAIDTNRYTDAERGEPGSAEVFRTAQEIHVPFVVLGELRYDFLQGTKAAQNEQRLNRFLATPRVQVLFPDDTTTQEYARLAAQLRRQGTWIPTNDVWIAALVLQHRLALYDRDRHFDHLPQLTRI